MLPSDVSLLFRKSNSASSESFFFALTPAGLLTTGAALVLVFVAMELVEDRPPPVFVIGLGVDVVVGCPNRLVSDRWEGTLEDGERGLELGNADRDDGCFTDDEVRLRGESVTGLAAPPDVSSSRWNASAADLSSLLRKSSAFPVTADSQDMAVLPSLA